MTHLARRAWHRLVAGLRLRALVLGLPLVLALVAVAGCGSSAAWQTQRTAADAVGRMANEVALPTLQQAYSAGGLAAVAASQTRDEAEQRVAVIVVTWSPTWDAYDATAAAQQAWAQCIDEGPGKCDPVRVAAGARDSYCKLRRSAKGLGIRIPDLPWPMPCPATTSHADGGADGGAS